MKVSIIGCSHSNGVYDKNKKVRNDMGWVYELSRVYPNHTFSCYTFPGCGDQFFEQTLKYLLLKGVDLILLQTTDFRVSYTMNREFNDFYDIENLFSTPKKITDNLNLITRNENIQNVTYYVDKKHIVRSSYLDSLPNDIQKTLQSFGHYDFLMKYSNAMFHKFIPLYKKILNNIFVLNWKGITNNILINDWNLPPVYSYFTECIMKEQQVNYRTAKQILYAKFCDDGHHLTEENQKRFFNEYLMSNEKFKEVLNNG